ncbi:NAD(P)H-dependent glycerol-3-phosphate dehydrogenase [Sulfitobacter donghicola]|uniref:Glycerol-3-phosphate dehydrogenase [NAD(P)+] n=1 Tax=Sulfitobacter donghicola DSW-25 = KCTC 12864 = JCM 14565 TaxID=1300350 RepID=A0A073ILK8_9RHOB|nr:NAD(P)H-dependent glycerol-3-phosphate dehydrogenase [Sulfitobacter donghicola]KEJ90614.1 glycerol-3-phosphate dehydrogenase [Sulfitobacter donghicola DSW-25 = KCTC 12864 = JCM 14565]KIN67863.1 Glycerol-3-phosphate dehydrogenase [NAD(P)+] [Sulfitobacter donghicola DSW-25 = KCTC 12864 = JCM 14565]
MSVSVLGAGAFGTALAIALAGQGAITLWARDAGDMQSKRENTRRLPDCRFPDQLTVTPDLDEAAKADIILLAVPMQQLRGFLADNANLLSGKALVACCKGVELSTGVGPIQIITQEVPNAQAAILTGPSFAADIARGLPTALTIAAAKDNVAKMLQEALTTPSLRLYRTTDTIGAELGGALKNVVAIACGTAMGAGMGESARAALMTRGYAEMQRMAAYRGADPETLAGLSGFGDLTLTCTSEGSRNYCLGLSLGRGEAFDPSTTTEGAATAHAVAKVAKDAGLEMPITMAVAGLLDKSLDVKAAVNSLLNRPLKEE